MSCYLALLRGVNVTGSTLRMAELKESLTDMGLEDVQTYLQSGNVVFKSKEDAATLAGQIDQSLVSERLVRCTPRVVASPEAAIWTGSGGSIGLPTADTPGLSGLSTGRQRAPSRA